MKFNAASLDGKVRAHMEKSPLAYEERLANFAPSGNLDETIAVEGSRYYRYLYALAKVVKPKTVLELGTYNGGSTLFLLLGLPGKSKLVSCDLNSHQPFYLAPAMPDARLNLVTCDTATDEAVQATGLRTVDLLIIDTLHTYDQVKREWELFGPLMKPGGVVIFDDIMLGDVGRFWKELKLDKVDTGGRYHWSGFGIAIKS